MNYQKLLKVAKQDLEYRPDLSEACSNVLVSLFEGELSRIVAKKRLHLTFGSIRKASKVDLTANQVVDLTQYLCGSRMNLFDVGFEYISDDEQFVLSEENSVLANQEDMLAHPRTGALIYDVQDKVYMFFTMRDSLHA